MFVPHNLSKTDRQKYPQTKWLKTTPLLFLLTLRVGWEFLSVWTGYAGIYRQSVTWLGWVTWDGWSHSHNGQVVGQLYGRDVGCWLWAVLEGFSLAGHLCSSSSRLAWASSHCALRVPKTSNR